MFNGDRIASFHARDLVFFDKNESKKTAGLEKFEQYLTRQQNAFDRMLFEWR